MKEKSLNLEINNAFSMELCTGEELPALRARGVSEQALARERESVYDMHYYQVLSETLSCFLKVVCKHNL